MAEQSRVLIVDDDEDILVAARLMLKREGILCHTEPRPDRIPHLLKEGSFDAVLLDMNFAIGANTGREGFQWLKRIVEIDPTLSVVLITAYGDVGTAVEAMKQGAADFVLKPWQNERLLATLSSALKLTASKREARQSAATTKELAGVNVDGASSTIIGSSPAMARIFALLDRAAPTEANVLILGENGTGKEVIAREIHRRSKRRDQVFVSVDLGSVSESLFESELFGHKKGAFTDAKEDRVGRLVAANGGTLFLDEIGNLPLYLQSKLLSVLEQRVVIPVGGTKPISIDVRLVSATNMPLDQLGREDVFRQDLLYRINTVELHLPPLRDRADDIPVLIDHFVAIYARKYNMPAKKVSPGALPRLMAWRWPGNVRALRHAVERAMILSAGPMLEAEDFSLPSTAGQAAPTPAPPVATSGNALILDTLDLEAVEREAIRKALSKHQGNISHAAQDLGITRASLYRRMEKHGL
ncbi:sigma-54-dependent Fis family transcriptional regulator [Niveispirillum lacus]|uniref:Sigma-54-dependent Fis family transcriptional regulator n=1 Tax=Niveispirillum lacus TaxID=1981099 RepID=A0A255YWM6_9PROT|nr:sigma-54 dependent transcriptional regulator [Niveispirillum lacus]OYQ33581.1 sigma-54-dependent Fis family transcriptional regulator [Niveispirillum lacus]